MIAHAVIDKEFCLEPWAQDQVHLGTHKTRAGSAIRLLWTGGTSVPDIKGEEVAANAAGQPNPGKRLGFQLEIRSIGGFQHITVCGGAGGNPFDLPAQPRM